MQRKEFSKFSSLSFSLYPSTKGGVPIPVETTWGGGGITTCDGETTTWDEGVTTRHGSMV